MKSEISTCPFCGSKDIHIVVSYNATNEFCVECRGCLANGPLEHSKENAIKKWNNRDQGETA